MLLLVGYIVVSHSTRSIVYPSSVSKIRDVDFQGQSRLFTICMRVAIKKEWFWDGLGLFFKCSVIFGVVLNDFLESLGDGFGLVVGWSVEPTCRITVSVKLRGL